MIIETEHIDPYKFTAEVKEKLLEMLRSGVSKKTAIEACGISRGTFYAHLRADSTFKEDVVRAEAESIDLVEDALFDKCLRGNVPAITFFLKCRRPAKWSEKPKDEGGGFTREELETKVEQLIEIALRRIPEEERGAFIGDLRSVAGLGESDRKSIEAPDSFSD